MATEGFVWHHKALWVMEGRICVATEGVVWQQKALHGNRRPFVATEGFM